MAAPSICQWKDDVTVWVYSKVRDPTRFVMVLDVIICMVRKGECLCKPEFYLGTHPETFSWDTKHANNDDSPIAAPTDTMEELEAAMKADWSIKKTNFTKYTRTTGECPKYGSDTPVTKCNGDIDPITTINRTKIYLTQDEVEWALATYGYPRIPIECTPYDASFPPGGNSLSCWVDSAGGMCPINDWRCTGPTNDSFANTVTHKMQEIVEDMLTTHGIPVDCNTSAPEPRWTESTRVRADQMEDGTPRAGSTWQEVPTGGGSWVVPDNKTIWDLFIDSLPF